jgi:hypothetical protein
VLVAREYLEDQWWRRCSIDGKSFSARQRLILVFSIAGEVPSGRGQTGQA